MMADKSQKMNDIAAGKTEKKEEKISFQTSQNA
jgi:hypothetical protein